MGLGSRALSVVRRPICVGAWQLGQPASTGSCVGSRPVGPSRRGLCLHRRVLALTLIELICFYLTQGRHQAISMDWHRWLALSKVQREPSYELKRVFLVSDLRIIQEVIDRRY